MNRDDMRAEIVRLGPWHQDIEVSPGIRTGQPVPPGTYSAELGVPTVIRPERNLDSIVSQVYPGGLSGRSILDCACNAGGYLFAGARLGAGRSVGFDVRDHWIRQARFLAEHLPSENIRFFTSDLMALPDLQLGRFDVTMFIGIFYHLPDPVTGLRIAADHTKELLVLNTTMLSGRGDALVINPESTTLLMSGVHNLAWIPSGERVLREILQWCGFPHTRVHFKSAMDGKHQRIQILAARESETFSHYDALHAGAESRWTKWWRRLIGRT
jgi:tRNA (mo5U34)-methyltransferase